MKKRPKRDHIRLALRRNRQEAVTARLNRFERLEPRILLAADSLSPALPGVHADAIFAPGTSQEYMDLVHSRLDGGHEADQEYDEAALDTYQVYNRWNSTGSDGGGLSWGDATTITWSIVPDGTQIGGFVGETPGASNFIAFMNGIYGSVSGGVEAQPWFNVIKSVFDRWNEVSGLNFVYETNDDGAMYSNNSTFAPGVLGVRGDVRIGGHNIDGNSGTLAYNFYPNNGEMVIDTADSYYSSTGSNSLRLRNVMAHEVGHGIGLAHVDPVNRTKLMEPFASTSFDGPQHDDILAAQRLYGDNFELGAGNDSFGTAASLGSLGSSGLNVGNNAANQYVGIDGLGDRDYFSFTVAANTTIDVQLAPLGQTYNQGPQGGTTSSFNSLEQNDLRLELFDSTFTLIASADNTALGGSEMITDLALSAGGTYYAVVRGDRDAAQLYQLDLAESGGAPPEFLDFRTFTIDSYGGSGQDVTGSYNVEDEGSTLRLTGNLWKKINFNYTVTPDTIIEFDFASGAEGEVQGIGFDTDLGISSNRTFKVHGTQNWGITDYDNYANTPGYQHYVIPIGSFYTGTMPYLFFANDHDVSAPTGESVFSNVKIYNASGPVAVDDTFSVDEDSATTMFDVLANDDERGSAVTITAVGAGSASGSISIGSSGRDINYQPAADFFGTETFTYTMANASGQSTATVTVDVQSVNDAPTAVDDTATVTVDSAGNAIDVLADDTFAPDSGETLTITSTSAGSAGGTVSHDGTQVTYAPASGFTGTETFTYTINDGTPGSNDTAAVTVTVVDDVLNFNAYTIDSYGGSGQDKTGSADVEEGGRTLRLTGNLWKKIDVNYTVTADTVLELDFSSSAQGEVHGIGFDSDLGISSNLTFKLHGTQNWGRRDFDSYSSSPALQHFVIPVGQFYTGAMPYLFFSNDHDIAVPTGEGVFSNIRLYEQSGSAPSAVDDSFSVTEDSSASVLDVLANDDEAGSAVTITSVGNGSAGGSITIVSGGREISYQPTADFFGTETFTYTIGNSGGQSTATISVTVQPVNDAPTAVDDAASVAVDSAGNVISVLNNDTIAPDSGETLTITSVSAGSAGGTITHDGTQATYTPVSGFMGTETFTYTVNDGTAGSDATATVTVSVVDDVLNFDAFTIDSYGGSGQDKTGSAQVENGGRTLRLTGNLWKKIDINYIVTADTMLEFDFASSAEGEVHGIGFDTDLAISSGLTFRVHGTQNWGLDDFDSYSSSPAFEHYVIPVGQFYTGTMPYLFFANDHDVSAPTGEGVFSDIRLYETPGLSGLAAVELDSPAAEDNVLPVRWGTLFDAVDSSAASPVDRHLPAVAAPAEVQPDWRLEIGEAGSDRLMQMAGSGGNHTSSDHDDWADAARGDGDWWLAVDAVFDQFEL